MFRLISAALFLFLSLTAFSQEIPEGTCVSNISKVTCKHLDVTSIYFPYDTIKVQTACTMRYELRDEMSGALSYGKVSNRMERDILVNENGVTFVANLLTINAIEFATVKTARGLNQKDLKNELDKVRESLNERKCFFEGDL